MTDTSESFRKLESILRKLLNISIEKQSDFQDKPLRY